jgi:hypothetical protein
MGVNITELNGDLFRRGIRMFDCFPHDRAWLEPNFEGGRGRFFVDAADDPGVVFYTPCLDYAGLGFFFGNADSPRLAAFLRELIAARLFRLELISVPDDAWKEKLLALLDGDARALERVAYRFDAANTGSLQAALEQEHAGYEATKMDERLCDEVGRGLFPDFTRIWPVPGDFARESAGYCALHEGRPVAVSYSGFQRTGKILMSVFTHEAHRRKGLACWTSAHVVRDLAAQGLECHWTTFTTNHGSRVVAKKLGFGHEVFHWWLALRQP